MKELWFFQVFFNSDLLKLVRSHLKGTLGKNLSLEFAASMGALSFIKEKSKRTDSVRKDILSKALCGGNFETVMWIYEKWPHFLNLVWRLSFYQFDPLGYDGNTRNCGSKRKYSRCSMDVVPSPHFSISEFQSINICDSF